jgi:hypothetical protein
MATFPSNLTCLSSSELPILSGNGLRATLGMPTRHVIARQAEPQATMLSAIAKEPEDARLTGGTRSLDRRLLALNLFGVTRKLKVSAERVKMSLQTTAA